MNGDLTFLLVHGSWHVGSCWSAVADHLREAGFPVSTPTLAGHGIDCHRERVTHDDYVRSVVDELDATDGQVVLVGHSFGGSVVSRVAELRPQRCGLLLYYSAFVPRHGERVADSLPEPMIAFLEDAAAATPDRSVMLPRELFASAFANTADDAAVDAFHRRLVPEPSGPIFEKLSLPTFHELGLPAAYISCQQDRALPPGSFHPGQSSRLDAPQLIEIDTDHEALFTSPRQLASALLQAVRAGERSLVEPART